MKLIRISLAAKSALDILVLYHSKNPLDQEYVKDISLMPNYHLTPEVVKELVSNGLIDNKNMPTKTGIWFAYNHGVTDAAPAFQQFVRKLSTKARSTLAIFCIGELAKEHQATKNPTKRTEVETYLNNLEMFFTGTTIRKLIALNQLPKREKGLDEITDSYDTIIEYNQRKH